MNHCINKDIKSLIIKQLESYIELVDKKRNYILSKRPVFHEWEIRLLDGQINELIDAKEVIQSVQDCL